MASNKILLSRQGDAMSTLIGDESVCGLVLVPPADPIALARAIAGVADAYPQNYTELATRALYDRCLSNESVVQRVTEEVEKL